MDQCAAGGADDAANRHTRGSRAFLDGRAAHGNAAAVAYPPECDTQLTFVQLGRDADWASEHL